MSGLHIEHDVPLAPLTTLGLGGRAAHFARVHDEASLVDALRWARDEGLPAAIMAGGSNLIVPDDGYPGLVVHMSIGGLELDEDGHMRVGAGTPWEAVVDGAINASFAGVECLTGIPGSTGATPIQNVGAYGQEVASVIESVGVVERTTLVSKELTPSECGFGYRDSMFKRDPERFVVTGVRFRLLPGGRPTVRYAELERSLEPGASLAEVRDTVLALRRRKSMVIDPDDPNRRSAGSFFLNPVIPTERADSVVEHAVASGLVDDPNDVPRYPAGDGQTKFAAGWLIEKAGIEKGMRRGPVGVSSKHALALVHHGGGTTDELLALASYIRTRVADEFGIALEREPRLLR
jgi:UDP-N-acetylmuramate dehydrogenase